MLGAPLRLPKLQQPQSTHLLLSPGSPGHRDSSEAAAKLHSVTFESTHLLPSPRRTKQRKSPLRPAHVFFKPKSVSPSHASSHNQLSPNDLVNIHLRRLVAVKKRENEEKRYSPLTSFPLQKKLKRRVWKPYEMEWVSPRRSPFLNSRVATITLGSRLPQLSPYSTPNKVTVVPAPRPVPMPFPLARPRPKPPTRSRDSSDDEDAESLSSWFIQSPKYL